MVKWEWLHFVQVMNSSDIRVQQYLKHCFSLGVSNYFLVINFYVVAIGPVMGHSLVECAGIL